MVLYLFGVGGKVWVFCLFWLFGDFVEFGELVVVVYG